MVTATSDGQSVELTFEIPRLKWGVSSTGLRLTNYMLKPSGTRSSNSLSQASLWIRTGKAASFQVALTTPDGRLLQERPEKTTSKRGGRAQVDLTRSLTRFARVAIRLVVSGFGSEMKSRMRCWLDCRYLVKSFELEVSAGVGFMIFDEVAPLQRVARCGFGNRFGRGASPEISQLRTALTGSKALRSS